MELIKETHKAPMLAHEDFISNMPDIVITNILDRLQIQDAIRTGILSRNWRCKWTLLSQLVFDWKFFNLLTTRGENNYFEVMSRILLRLKGAITKFDLIIEDEYDLDAEDMNTEDINNLILLLSRKGIKDLTIENCSTIGLKLPTHLFSCLELKHLKIRDCYFDPPPTFKGFPNLLCLDLRVEFRRNIQLGEFFTRCPLVENLAMDHLFQWDKLILDGIAKLENLKILSLRFFDHDVVDTSVTSSSTIFELLGSLPKLEELKLNFEDYSSEDDDSLPKREELKLDFEDCRSIEGGANKRFSTIFPSLKVLKLRGICLHDGTMLSCAFKLIRSCSNMLFLEITTQPWYAYSPPQIDYDTMWPLRLRRVVIWCFKGSENELRLIEYLLACSPDLDKIEIGFLAVLTSDEKLSFILKLLKFHRASDVAEIELF